MKKFISILSVFLLMVILALCGSAVSFMPGDMNGDEKITASDARSILRIAAKLDDVSAELLKVADVNNDGEVRASDARIVLRVAAQLETIPGQEESASEPETDKEQPTDEHPSDEPTAEDQTNNTPQKLPADVQTFLGNVYTLTGNVYTPDSIDPVDTLLICDGKILRMDATFDGLNFGLMTDTVKNEAYAISPSKNLYTPLSDTLIKTLGISDSMELFFTSSDGDDADPEPIISYGTLNGQQSVVYTFIYPEEKIEIITIDEKIEVINYYSDPSVLSMRIEVTSLTNSVDSDMLALTHLTRVNVPSFLASLLY